MGRNNEGAIIAQVLIEATKNGWRLFRNSVGQAWQGRITEEYPLTQKNGPPLHVIELAGARRVTYGLRKGSSDLIGWRPVVITAEMVGQTIAQFVSVEVKTDAYGRVTEEQQDWLENVDDFGGFAAIARGKKVKATPEMVGQRVQTYVEFDLIVVKKE